MMKQYRKLPVSKSKNKKEIVKDFGCPKCEKAFVTQKGLNQHTQKKHPYIPPPPPKKETICAPNVLDENHRLINGDKLKIGDLIWLGRKCVITKITRTEGSKDVEVTVKITKMWYSSSEIS